MGEREGDLLRDHCTHGILSRRIYQLVCFIIYRTAGSRWNHKYLISQLWEAYFPHPEVIYIIHSRVFHKPRLMQLRRFRLQKFPTVGHWPPRTHRRFHKILNGKNISGSSVSYLIGGRLRVSQTGDIFLREDAFLQWQWQCREVTRTNASRDYPAVRYANQTLSWSTPAWITTTTTASMLSDNWPIRGVTASGRNISSAGKQGC